MPSPDVGIAMPALKFYGRDGEIRTRRASREKESIILLAEQSIGGQCTGQKDTLDGQGRDS